jgi:prepilin-type N-terminal cleavage/methylation domain-containing protein
MKLNESKERGATDVKVRGVNEKGFTLLETSIALVLLLVAGLGVVSMFTYSIRFNSGGDDRAMAASIAQEQVEQLRSVKFDDTILNVGTVAATNTVRNGRTYQVSRTITGSNNNVSGNPTLKTITIRVDPTSPGWAGFPVIIRTVRSATTGGAN